jgi:undecaprenyl diphosphate synthase
MALDPGMNTTPYHVAIVMDGNGRWAQRRGMARSTGHSSGVPAIRRITEVAARLGVTYLSLFAFSRENWNRAPEEVNHLFHLLELYLAKETPTLMRNGIRLRVIGLRDALAPSVQAAIEHAEHATRLGERMQLIIAVNFSGRWELTETIESIRRSGASTPITEALVAEHMPYRDIPPPDLFIRTAGERRISNYFLWNLAYTELYFTNVCWPAFGARTFRAALTAFAKRHRTYGALPNVVRAHVRAR